MTKKKKIEAERNQEQFFDYLNNLIQTESIIEDILDSPKTNLL